MQWPAIKVNVHTYGNSEQKREGDTEGKVKMYGRAWVVACNTRNIFATSFEAENAKILRTENAQKLD